MPLSKSFASLVQGRVAHDAAFAAALLCEGIDALLAGDHEAGKALLRDHIRGTVGFEALGKATAISPPVLRRMLRPGGNPYSRSLLDVIAYLQQQAGIELHVVAGPRDTGSECETTTAACNVAG